MQTKSANKNGCLPRAINKNLEKPGLPKEID